jgi:hypothetical protein
LGNPVGNRKRERFRNAWRRVVYKGSMSKAERAKTPMQIVSYVVSALIAVWLIIWMLELSGINIL